jgi:hypothetical protein
MHTSQHIAQVQRALAMAGNTHSLGDILELLETGEMQSFVVNDSWAVTRLVQCPRKLVVEIFLVTGADEDMPALEGRVREFARRMGATMIRALGREGWARRAPERGWTVGQRLYTTEV